MVSGGDNLIVFQEKDYEKRDKIVNAAMEAFGKNGYEKTSTNNIVKIAGVSKGLLYHYFASKKELYDYLMEFCFKTVASTLKEKMDWQETDFFERLKQATKVKFELTKIYPSIYDFAVKCMNELSEEEVMHYMQKYSLDLLSKVYYENVDFSLFKEDIDTQKAIQIVQWTFEKYGEQVRSNTSIDMEVVIKQVDEYIVFFKNVFY